MKNLLRVLAVLFALATGGLAVAGPSPDAALAPQGGKHRNAAPLRDSDAVFQVRRNAVYRQWLRDKQLNAGKGKGKIRPPKPKPGSGKVGTQSLVESAPFTYLPSGATNDGRFICIAGTQNLSTLTSDLFIRLSAASSVSSITLGLFDGDNSGMWDLGTGQLEFDLFADPEGDGGVSGTLIDSWNTTSFAYPDNAWRDRTIVPPASAQTANGNFFFVLRVRLTNPNAVVLNCFKLRTNTSIRMQPQFSFNFIAMMSSTAEMQTIYPDYPDLTSTTYDGTWNFYVYVPKSSPFFEMWDGDSDHGNADGTDPDTDDADTSATDPPWWPLTFAREDEGASTSSPPDNTTLATHRRSPAIQYALTLPTGERFLNTNPTGDEEWEQFKLDTVTAVGADHLVSSLPGGVYQISVSGMDLLNLNAMRFDYDLLGVTIDGQPVQPVLPYNLGDRVFFDTDSDGVYEPGEDTNGNGILDRDFDRDGDGTIENEDDNNNGVLDDGEDDDTNGILDVEDVILPKGTFQTEDTNANSTLDGEVGVSGVKLNLLYDGGSVMSSTTTDSSGKYLFPVEGGTYGVQVDPSNFVAGGPLEGYRLTTTGPGNPSGTNPLVGIVPKSGTNNLEFDFGYSRPSETLLALGDRVWLDYDGDELQDSLEPGLPGVRLELWQGGIYTGTSRITDATGYYLFDTLTDNTTYMVKIDQSTLPSNVTQTHDLDGLGTPHEATTTLAGGINLNVDFGYEGVNTLGDRVWLDRDSDGVQDAGEAGIGSITLVVKGDINNDSVTDFEIRPTTDSSGNYLVPNLPAGTYKIEVDTNSLPYGLQMTYDPDDAAVNPDTPGRSEVTFPAGLGTSNLLQDFGYVGVGTIQGTVWNDDCDGVLEMGEAGIDAVTVTLKGDFDDDGVIDLTLTTTTSSGAYSFPNVPAAVYQVIVNSSGLGSVSPSYDIDGTSTPSQAELVLLAGQTRSSINFGYCASVATASVGDKIWYDADGDGLQDSLEPGQTGVTVQLWAVGGMAAITSQTTTSTGTYLFSGLSAGQYYVRFVLPTPGATDTRYNFTNALRGGVGEDSDANVTLDGDNNALTARTADFNLLAGENNLTLDAGVIIAPCIMGYVVIDADRNAVYDDYPVAQGGEELATLAGISVRIVPPSPGSPFNVVTDAAGKFEVEDIAPGTYQVSVNYTAASAVGQPLNGKTHRTIDPDGVGTPDTAGVVVSAGECRYVVFGYATAPKINTTSPWRTQTQGGWGSDPTRGNPGGFLHQNWATVFGTASLTLGRKQNPGMGNIASINRIILTSAQAVTNFLPQGGTPARLSTTHTNPLFTEAAVFGGQITAVQLAVRFSEAGITRTGIGDLKLNLSGNAYHNKTVYFILDEAHKALANPGFNLINTATMSSLNDALSTINENFVDGTINQGHLVP